MPPSHSIARRLISQPFKTTRWEKLRTRSFEELSDSLSPPERHSAVATIGCGVASSGKTRVKRCSRHAQKGPYTRGAKTSGLIESDQCQRGHRLATVGAFRSSAAFGLGQSFSAGRRRSRTFVRLIVHCAIRLNAWPNVRVRFASNDHPRSPAPLINRLVLSRLKKILFRMSYRSKRNSSKSLDVQLSAFEPLGEKV